MFRIPRSILLLCSVAIVGLAAWIIFVITVDDSGLSHRSERKETWPILEPLSEASKRLVATVISPEAFDLADLSPVDTTTIGRVAPILEPGSSRAATSFQTHGFRHQWPATYATANFDGAGVIIVFNDAINRYSISFDNAEEPAFIVTQPGNKAVHIDGLGPRKHTVRLDKITESLSEATEIRGFFMPAGGKSLAPPPKSIRRIEFIGDSDTVGYGNTSPSRDCQGDSVFYHTNTLKSFGPRVARDFNADYHVIASSGIGLIRNLEGGNPEMTMTERYQQVLLDGSGVLQADGWNPQVVVLALGSNDFATEMGRNEQWVDLQSLRMDFETRYVRFLESLRARYPRALFVLIAMKDYGSDYMAAHKFVQSHFAYQGDDQVKLAVIPKMQKTGCHWHPSLDDHQMIAEAIIDIIKSQRDVWQDGSSSSK